MNALLIAFMILELLIPIYGQKDSAELDILAIIPATDLIEHPNLSAYQYDSEIAQFLDLSRMNLNTETIGRHKQLCAPLVITAMMGLSVEESFSIMETTYSGEYTFRTGRALADGGVIELLHGFGWQAIRRPQERALTCHTMPGDEHAESLCNFKSWLLRGKVIMGGNTLDAPYGVLTSTTYTIAKTVPYFQHWVLVLAIFDGDNQSMVQVYNPLMNREEVYTWNDFYRVYDEGGRDVIIAIAPLSLPDNITME